MTVANARLFEGRTRSDGVSGTSFPADPYAGQLFYRTDHHCLYCYDATIAEWLSVSNYELTYGMNANTAATAYLKFHELGAFTTFTDSFGWIIGARVRVVGMTIVMNTGTATVQVFSSGSAVGNSSLAVSSFAAADEAMLGDAIAANTALAVKVVSGTVNTPVKGIIRLKRAELP